MLVLLCMKPNLRAISFLLLFVPASVARAQSDPESLEQALAGKQLVLRSYSADPIARYTWNDGNLATDTVQLHTFGIFAAKSVKLKGKKITIQGERATLLNDSKNNRVGLSAKSPMTLEINLGASDPTQALPLLQESLFFPDVASAKAALPPQLKDVFPFNLVARSPSACHCEQFFDADHWKEAPVGDRKLVQPRLTNMIQPELTSEVRDAKVSGTVTVMFFISPTGIPEDVWLAKPVAPGLDNSAATAIRKYRFAPAQYDGHPVGVELAVEVNFQI
jgi:TonB family protein